MIRIRTRLLGASAAVVTGLLAVALAVPAHAAPAPRDPDGAKHQLDATARQAPDEVAGWWIDESARQLVVNVVGPRTAASDRFTAGLDAASVRIEPFSAPVRKTYSLVGGQAIYDDATGGRCSIGFSARRGADTFILVAGHCTRGTTTWSGYNHIGIGPAVATNLPNDDFGLIKVNDTTVWQPTAQVQGGPSVLGSTESAVGAGVCRSGSSTGYRCGTIEAKDQTVNYGDGDVVYGLTRTSACAEPGDSGGSFIDPASRQAQGMTSGGSGDCTIGGQTFFQPVNEALQQYNLTLVTDTPAPPATPGVRVSGAGQFRTGGQTSSFALDARATNATTGAGASGGCTVAGGGGSLTCTSVTKVVRGTGAKANTATVTGTARTNSGQNVTFRYDVVDGANPNGAGRDTITTSVNGGRPATVVVSNGNITVAGT